MLSTRRRRISRTCRIGRGWPTRYHAELNETHRTVLSLLDITEQEFWN
jgi:hypothetical protein